MRIEGAKCQSLPLHQLQEEGDQLTSGDLVVPTHMRAATVTGVFSLRVLPHDDPIDSSGLEVGERGRGTGEDASSSVCVRSGQPLVSLSEVRHIEFFVEPHT